MLDDNISSLLGQIYAGAWHDDAWDDVLDRFKALSGSRMLMFSVVDTQARAYARTTFKGVDDGRGLDGIAEYGEHYHRFDPTLAYAGANPSAGMVSLADAIDLTDDAALDYAHWYREALGVSQSLVCYSQPINGMTIGLSLHRPLGEAPHDDEQKRLWRMLFDHVERAIRLTVQPPCSGTPGDARILIDQRGMIAAMSDTASAMIASADGLSVSQGMLTTIRRQDQPRLDAMIRSALDAFTEGTAGGSFRMQRRSGAAPWILTARPLPVSPSPGAALRAVAEIAIVDPEAALPAHLIERWRSALDLTPAEARLAAELFDGDGTLRDAAARRGIAYGTARVQLASIFAKSGVRSQSKLMRLLSRLNALLLTLTAAGQGWDMLLA